MGRGWFEEAERRMYGYRDVRVGILKERSLGFRLERSAERCGIEKGGQIAWVSYDCYGSKI